MLENCTLKFAKTLWRNTYRGFVLDDSRQNIASFMLVPQLPLARSEVPVDAPTVPPYVLVLMEDAKVSQNNFIDLEATLSPIIIAKLTTEIFIPEYCQFTYPSPVFML